MAGAFYAHYLGTITPRSFFDINVLFQIIVAVLIGGAGTIIGPIIGAFFMVFLLAWLRPYLPGAERFFVYGTIALLIYMYQPKGIMAIIDSLVTRLKGARQ